MQCRLHDVGAAPTTCGSIRLLFGRGAVGEKGLSSIMPYRVVRKRSQRDWALMTWCDRSPRHWKTWQRNEPKRDLVLRCYSCGIPTLPQFEAKLSLPTQG